MENTTQAKSAPPIFTLHHLSSAGSHRVCWALEELNVPYALKNYTRKMGSAPPELASVFPLGVSPILEVHDPSIATYPKPGIMTEARLILHYLEENYANGAWTPKDPSDNLRNRYWEEFAAATLQENVVALMTFEILPLASPWFLRPLVRFFCNFMVEFKTPRLARILKLMEGSLSEEKPWFAGKKIGLADFVMSFPMDMGGQRGYIDPQKYPRLADWLEKVQARPAYQRALAKGPGYDFVTFDKDA